MADNFRPDKLQRITSVSWAKGDTIAVFSVRSFAGIFTDADLSNLFVKLQVAGDLHTGDRTFLEMFPEWVGSRPGDMDVSDPTGLTDEWPSYTILRNLPPPLPTGPLELYSIFNLKHYHNIDPGENEALGYIVINFPKIKTLFPGATKAKLILDPRPTHFTSGGSSSWGDLEFAITVVKLPEDLVEPIEFEQVRAGGGDVELFLSNVNGTRLYTFPGWQAAHPTTHFSYKGTVPNAGAITLNGVTKIRSIEFDLSSGEFTFAA
jgi:hypothetical protein